MVLLLNFDKLVSDVCKAIPLNLDDVDQLVNVVHKLLVSVLQCLDFFAGLATLAL